MGRNGPMTLAEFNKATGISKSAIRRLLFTLMEQSLVRKSLVDQKYRIDIYWASGGNKLNMPDVAMYMDIV